MDKIRVALIFGGQSEEHEVSVMTAREIEKAMDEKKYEITLFGIDKYGYWNLIDELNSETKSIVNNHGNVKIPNNIINYLQKDIDIAFPLLHGPFGEDGKIQGLFEMIGINYVGCNLLSSAICMDKDYTKKLLSKIGIRVVESITVFNNIEYNIEKIIDRLEFPMFVKPANLGSSVGIAKVKNIKQLKEGIKDAFKYDRKVLIEKAINARELECAILGNGNPKASSVGEIIPSHEFYDYESKYFDGGKTKLLIPAEISDDIKNKIQENSLKAYIELGCSGLARVDFLLDKDSEELYLNEINTMPGFTPFSMYPLLFKNTGIEYSELIDNLIMLARNGG